ncbi:MAG: nitroreductase family protein [Acidimicrobiia bacterium]|nr:nitroreductase family protein [Acidimicrobiia bacterium]MYE72522.1 nitroreductase family protein [Acidimicrobiia bacterium]MYJ62648.1 nitroreductase family protein [Acidimicrobiia bacterium]
MCRNYLPDPLPDGLVAKLLDQARRAPSAGNTQAVEFCVVTDPERYWRLTLTPQRRAEFPWPGLLIAPVLVVVLTNPQRYVERYAESDKAHTGLGNNTDAWPVPYWWVDAGMAVQTLLMAATAADLGACFFGAFEHEEAVLDGLELPAGHRIVGIVALGHPDKDRPSSSAQRPRRPLEEVIHYGDPL